MRRPSLLFAITCGVLALAGATAAGQTQEASIIGQVTDESGAILPGVTVTATSPALQVPQVIAVSDDRGEYRLTPLPLGTYRVDYMLPGFQIVRRENLRLTAGFTARVDVQLQLGALTETVTVSGAAPVVDVASAATRTQLTRETLDLIPTSRSGIQSALTQAPGVRTNLDFGKVTTENPVFRAFGQSHESWVLLDGMVTTSPKSASPGSGQWFDYTALEESTVQTVGSSAEAPTRGVQINVILKSGGDAFHGGGSWVQSGPRLQSDNLDEELRAQGVSTGNPVETRWDRMAELGGRIIREKLWFYYSARAHKESDVILNAFKPDGSPAVNSSRTLYSTVKLSYQMSPASRLIGFYQAMRRPTSGDTVTEFVPWESQQIGHRTVDTGKLEWQFARGNKLVSLMYGDWQLRINRDPLSREVGTFDEATLFVTGMNRQTPHRQGEGRKSSKGTVSWYKPDLFAGNHDFKAGFEYSPEAWSDGGVLDRGISGNYRLIFRNGAPFQFEAANNPVQPHNPVAYVGTYVQDTWTLARRLTLNLGARYAHENGALPEQCRGAAAPPLDVVFPAECFPKVQFNVWNSIVPRVHAVYDLTGDGRTVIKGGWGRFAHLRYVDEIQMANENAHTLAFFRWHDLNGNRAFDPGEVNFDRNGPDFLFTRLEVGETDAGAVPNPNEKQPITDEFSLSLERQLVRDLAVRVTGVYSRNIDTYRLQNNLRPYEAYNIPVTSPDPGPDGRRGTADDPGTLITYWEYSPALAGRAFQQPTLINDRGSDANFSSIEVAASKRFSNRWMFMAAYSATKLDIPFVPNTAGARTVLLTTFDPNAEINAANDTWEWLGRVSGAYQFPADVQVSANFEHRSGEPWGRSVSVAGGRTIPSQTVRVEPIGARRLPNVNLLHVRGEKSFRLRAGHRMTVRVNLFNALNVNTVLTVTQLSGRNFERPRTIVPPRIAEIGMSYSF
jgi:hypothetical protein